MGDKGVGAAFRCHVEISSSERRVLAPGPVHDLSELAFHTLKK
jgi:hypothetical protein